MASSEPPQSSTFSQPLHVETQILGGVSERENDKADARTIHGKRAILIALASNVLIGTIKFGAGFLGRHSSLISEGIHSYADAVNSGFLLIGLQKGSRAPDKSHPFGYGLETTLWAMLASLFMLVLACWSMYLGISRMIRPTDFEWYGLSAAVLIVSIILELMSVQVAATAVLNEKELVIDGWMNRYFTASRQVRTITSPTTRFVFYEDTIALFGSLVALVAITFSEYGSVIGLIPESYMHVPDAVASIVIGLMILGLSLYLFLHNSRGLTGSSAGPLVEQKIREFVMNLSGVSQINDLKTVDYGMSGVVVHLKLQVDPDILVKDVDDLTDRIKDRIQARITNVKEVLIEVLADESDEQWSQQFYRLIEQGRHSGVLKLREEQILRNVYDFTQAVVVDIMVPRTDVDCIDVHANFQELMALIAESGHARIPVYDDDIDNMLGAIDVKDVVAAILKGEWSLTDEAKAPELSSLVKKFDIYPENKPVSDLLEDFKRKKIQIAMVADEHGGFAGIVTLEDLLEEIVGEIFDDDDEEINWVEERSPNCIVVSGRLAIDELNERYELNIPDEEFNTLGGFVFGQLGREPLVGDTVQFEELVFSILEMEGHRVNKIQVEGPDLKLKVIAEEAALLPITPSLNNTVQEETAS